MSQDTTSPVSGDDMMSALRQAADELRAEAHEVEGETPPTEALMATRGEHEASLPEPVVATDEVAPTPEVAPPAPAPASPHVTRDRLEACIAAIEGLTAVIGAHNALQASANATNSATLDEVRLLCDRVGALLGARVAEPIVVPVVAPPVINPVALQITEMVERLARDFDERGSQLDRDTLLSMVGAAFPSASGLDKGEYFIAIKRGVDAARV